MDERCRSLRRALTADPSDRDAARALLAHYARAGAELFQIVGPDGGLLDPELDLITGLDGPLRFVHPDEAGAPRWWIFLPDFGAFLDWARALHPERRGVVSRFTIDWPRRLVYYGPP